MDDQDYLFELDDMRRDNPVLWLVFITGPTTTRSVAVKLMIEPDAVLLLLRELKGEGWVTDRENPRAGQPVLWEATSALQDLYDWRQEWLKSRGFSRNR